MGDPDADRRGEQQVIHPVVAFEQAQQTLGGRPAQAGSSRRLDEHQPLLPQQPTMPPWATGLPPGQLAQRLEQPSAAG